MVETTCTQIAEELRITPQQVKAVQSLIEAGATVPFIARYRKERTGSLDEVVIGEIRDRLARLAALDARRQAILKSLEEQGVLTNELCEFVESATTMSALEDVYLTYRPKRRTRSTIAKEKGLEPLAKALFLQQSNHDPMREAESFVCTERGVSSVEEALAGARDIIAEWINEDAEARRPMRELFEREGILQSTVVKGEESEGIKYSNYFDWQEPVGRAPGHRVLAMLRGENENYLKVTIRPPRDKALAQLHRRFIKGNGFASAQVALAMDDSYQRLLGPSIETDTRTQAKKRADEEALHVFARNLRETLMSAPMGPKTILAIDPGYRTGCKVVCLDPQGRLLDSVTVYPGQSATMAHDSAMTVRSLVERFGVQAIAIGNGTAGREAEEFVRGLGLPDKIPVVMVNESGASIYSASEVAREEFPEQDVTVRGAISIGRRLMDPLAELVKIEPRSIGVGQYQHDVDQVRLRDKLDEVVTSCVNEVGVKVNTASRQLLTYVSGLGPTLARNIIAYRNAHGPFRSRQELKKVPRLGPKAFELAAGFLRIDDADNPLDASAVHPESYHIVERMAKDLRCDVSDLMHRGERRGQIRLESYVGEDCGLPTLKDIMAELARPGRDPRERFEAVAFADDIRTIGQLAPGMKLAGIVTNVTNFGAFVDVGVHHDGLVHISELADRFVKDPADVIKVNQKVTVTVLAVDTKRGRISLSMKNLS
ncbi:MAG: RNA-binding transcriptional accessory protein [Chloroflexi bacterium]|nr:RNA-binding transcriptional accessory protein [Chloroflexota bacterium]